MKNRTKQDIYTLYLRKRRKGVLRMFTIFKEEKVITAGILAMAVVQNRLAEGDNAGEYVEGEKRRQLGALALLFPLMLQLLLLPALLCFPLL